MKLGVHSLVLFIKCFQGLHDIHDIFPNKPAGLFRLAPGNHFEYRFMDFEKFSFQFKIKVTQGAFGQQLKYRLQHDRQDRVTGSPG